jgi:group I intron endonuclease
MKSGIYKITNLLNNKVYIGQSKNIPNRFKGHIRQRSRNYPLYNSFRKYGIDNFKFEVIEYADINILDELEIKYIKKYKSLINENGYNIKDGGNGRPNTNSIVYDNLDNIINDISNTNIFIKDIAKKYNISSSLVSSINNGLR